LGQVKKISKTADIHEDARETSQQTAIERKRAFALWMWEQLTR
jgi:hypothetical protein